MMMPEVLAPEVELESKLTSSPAENLAMADCSVDLQIDPEVGHDDEVKKTVELDEIEEYELPEPEYPHLDLESMLKVPSTILFPLELSQYLKDKLTAVVEENWHLMKHLKSQEFELDDLRKFRDASLDPTTALRKESPTILSSKVIDLSKKNRDMSAQNEGMKTKIHQLLTENESMKRMLSTVSSSSSCLPGNMNGTGDGTSIDGSVLGTSRTDMTDISNVNLQLTKTTSKMMEYRRQNQMLQMELRTALKVLCQEVGEGTTVKSIMKEVTGPESTWRGRQQQIIALTQKVSDLQLKLAQAQQNIVSLQQDSKGGEEEDDPTQGLHLYHIHNGPSDMGGGGDNMCRPSNIPVLINPATRRQVSTLHHVEKKKQNHLDSLSHELQAVRNELKSSQLEAKGSKARTQFLECQVRTLRVDLDEASIKLRSKQELLQQAQDELKELRHELLVVREREKKHRETSSTELQESNQALARERIVVGRLQKLIAEKQDHLQKLDSKVARLQDDVLAHSSSSTGSVDYIEKIKILENQLQLATQSIHGAEKERERLLTLISNSVGEAQQERQSHGEAERLFSRSLAILSLTDSCINRCLDAGQVTNKPILEEVEEIRALVRELKAGTSSSSINFELPKLLPQHSKSTPVMTFGESCNKIETWNRKDAFSKNSPARRQLNSRK